MGAASTVLLFDVRRHLEVTVPAIQTWIERGELAPWWNELIGRARGGLPVDAYREALREWPGFLEGIALSAALPARARAVVDDATRMALELAFLTSARDGVCFANASSLVVALAELDSELEALLTDARAGSEAEPRGQLARLVVRLDQGLCWLAHSSGGFGP